MTDRSCTKDREPRSTVCLYGGTAVWSARARRHHCPSRSQSRPRSSPLSRFVVGCCEKRPLPPLFSPSHVRACALALALTLSRPAMTRECPGVQRSAWCRSIEEKRNKHLSQSPQTGFIARTRFLLTPSRREPARPCTREERQEASREG